MRRLIGYMKPYRALVAISLVFLLAQSLFQVLGPLLTRTAVDRYLQPNPASIPSFLTRFLPADPWIGLARIAVMYLGWIVEVSTAAELYENPLHPYTISLLSAVPIPDPIIERQREPILLAGDLPSPANPPAACRFHTRCPFVQPTRCREEVPLLRKFSTGHEVACHWAEEIKEGRIKPHEREVVLESPRPELVAEPPPV